LSILLYERRAAIFFLDQTLAGQREHGAEFADGGKRQSFLVDEMKLAFVLALEALETVPDEARILPRFHRHGDIFASISYLSSVLVLLHVVNPLLLVNQKETTYET
jgi:hypothetical protein